MAKMKVYAIVSYSADGCTRTPGIIPPDNCFSIRHAPRQRYRLVPSRHRRPGVTDAADTMSKGNLGATASIISNHDILCRQIHSVTPTTPPISPPYHVNPAPVKIMENGSAKNSGNRSTTKRSRAPRSPLTAAHTTRVKEIPGVSLRIEVLSNHPIGSPESWAIITP